MKRCDECGYEVTIDAAHVCGPMPVIDESWQEVPFRAAVYPMKYESTAPLPPVDWKAPDPVNHPAHYTAHPSGIECIQITEHMGFNLGNAVKYVWRADLKGNAIEDLKKAAWYIEREIKRRGG